MQRSRGARLFPLLVIGIIVIVLIAGIVSVGRAVFSGQDSTTVNEEADRGRSQLLSTDPGSGVRLTVRGPIVADENFKSYTIEASPTARSMMVYTGYVEDIDSSKVLDNNDEAYEQFVYALDKANMMKGDVPADDAENDLRGICAIGYTYEYAVLQGDTVIKRLWSSTCDGSKGSLDASVAQLNSLFLAQIPDAAELVPFSQSAYQLRF